MSRGGARPRPEDTRRREAPRAAEPLSLPSAGDQWVAGEAVRRLIGAWAYGALPDAGRPASAEVRRALAVACALAELAHEAIRTPFGDQPERALWDVELEPHPARLADLAGVSDRDAAAGLDLLRRAGVVLGTADGGTRVRLSESACEAAPGVARVSWGTVRGGLRDAGAPANALAAPLAVVREVARASGPVHDPAAAPHVRYSVRELETATLFSRSTVSEALSLLERAGLVTTEARRGQTLRCALTPRAFGLAPLAPAHAPSAGRAPATDPAPDSVAREGSRSSTPPAQVEAPPPARPETPDGVVLLGEFAGTPIYGPAGTALVVECDAQGRWTCRVGPHLRLGPVA